MSLGTAIGNIAVRVGRFAVKYSPEILMGLGTVSVVSGTVVVAKNTLKLDELLEADRKEQEKIQKYRDSGYVGKVEYTEDDAKKDLMIVKKSAAIKTVKLYAPGALLITAGIACFFGAFGILKARNGALAIALASANQAFDEYRQRVIEDQGEDKDKEYLYGLKKEKIETVDPETGKKVKEEVFVSNGNDNISRYAIRYTPEFSTEAGWDVNYNAAMLRSIEHAFNAMLPGRKKIYLSEVYKELGVEETYESRLVGWDYNADNAGDGKIMFIITEIVERDDNSATGYRKELIVDFNVDGNVAASLPRNAATLGMEVEDHVELAERATTY